MNDWPHTSKEWTAYAASCLAHYPLMGTDWDQHVEAMKARRNRQIAEALDGLPDEAPLSPEEEESVQATGPATLF